MDYKRIFLKEAKPTSIGGQAIMEGVMMRGPDRNAIAVRVPDGRIYLTTEKLKPSGGWKTVPLVRGCVSFFLSLYMGMTTLTKSADILEKFMEEDLTETPGKFEMWLEKKFGERAAWNFMLIVAVVIALIVSIAGFVIFPTVAVSWLKRWITNTIVLNLIEGFFRIILFVLYILLIRKMEDIKTLFRYHGAEHKTIHCFENELELTPENAQQFYTLHPRCGTSFIMFVFIISLLLFSLLGWPNVWVRIASRLLLLPVIAGISYELLKWAGRSDNFLVRILSWPGLMLQKLTTAEPTDKQLEVAIVSLKAVLVDPDVPAVNGFVNTNAEIIEAVDILADKKEEAGDADEVGAVDKEATAEMPVIDETAADSDEAPEEEIEGSDDEAAAEDEAEADDVAEADEQPEKILPWPELEGRRYSNDPETIGNTIKRAQAALADVPNGKREAIDLFCYVMGMTKTQIVTRQTEIMSEDDIKAYEDRVKLRLSGVPMQYIVKVQEFYGLPFRVNESVLIPRLDSEVLVEQVSGIIKGMGLKELRILDLCTGSGALGISLAHEFPDSKVVLTDISEDALEVARTNAEINEVTDQCTFLQGNLFNALGEGEMFDMIVSNPPYIPTDVIPTLDTEVKDHEPILALDGGKDGLDAYRNITMEAADHLRPGGFLALEIGYDQANAVTMLLDITKCFNKAAVIKDLAGLDRVVIAERK